MDHRKEKDDSSKSHEEDLSTILTTEEQVELTLLIANITELMRKQILDNFDASISSGKPPQKALHITDENPNIKKDESKKEETEEEGEARKLREAREKELSAPNMQELKKEATEFFDKWRESVILRLGEVVNKPSKQVMGEKVEEASKKPPVSAPPMETKNIGEFLLTGNYHDLH